MNEAAGPGDASAAEAVPVQATWKRLAKAAIKLAIFAAMIFFWVVYVRKCAAGLHGMHWTIDWPAVLLSSVFFFLASVLFGVLWSPLCREISGVRLGPALAFRASMLAWIARYIPGKVWSVAGKAYFSRPEKSQAAAVTIAITVETIWFEVSGLLLAAIVLPWYPQVAAIFGGKGVASLIFIGASLLLAWPPIFSRICNFGLKLLRQPPLPRRPRYRVLLALMLGYMAVFALFSGGFISLAHSFAPELRMADFPLLAGVFTACWVIGVLTFLAPNGLGVRDTLLAVALLKTFGMSAPIAGTLALVCRLVGTVVEVICALIAVVMR